MQAIDWKAEKRSQFVWGAMIISFFAVQAVIWVFAITLTVNDQSHAIIPDYDRKALQWDELRVQQAASDQLGWVVTIQPQGQPDVFGDQPLELRVVDRSGQPVSGLEIRLEAFHCGQAARVQQLDFSELAEGQYMTQLRVRRAGQWSFRGAAIAPPACTPPASTACQRIHARAKH